MPIYCYLTSQPLTVNDLEEVTAKVKRWSQELFPFIKEVAHSNEPNPYLTKELEDEKIIERIIYVKSCLEEKQLPPEEIEGLLEKVCILQKVTLMFWDETTENREGAQYRHIWR